MRIGILGGSFSPIHHGHLLMAQLAQQKMNLDQVIFMPVHCSPYKISAKMQDGQHRLNMIRLAIKGNPYFSVSDLELKRGGVSYSVDTLAAIKVIYPTARLFWIIGDDHVDGLSGWRDFNRIVRMASFIAVSRLWFNISSTQIRHLIARSKSIRYLTPDAVIRYINKHHLYTHLSS